MLMRRAIIFGGGAAILLVVAIVAGWWLFIRADAELATDPPAIPTGLAESTAEPGRAPGDTLTFRIIPEESEAAYFVDEELASLPLPSTAKGATQAIEGEFVLTGDGLALDPIATSSFTVDLTTLQSDEDRRDSRVQGALETSAFPNATFTLSEVVGHDPSIPQEEQQTFMLEGTLDLHGVERDVTWEVEARREGNVITALATLTIDFADFSITPPNIAGFVSVSDQATLQVQLIAQMA